MFNTHQYSKRNLVDIHVLITSFNKYQQFAIHSLLTSPSLPKYTHFSGVI